MDARAERANRVAERRQLDADRTARGRNTPTISRWRRLRRRAGSLLVGWLAPLLMRLLAWTWRIERHGDSGLATLCGEAPCIIVVWHGRMLVTMALRHHCHRGIGVLVSPSDDGSLVTKALHTFGYAVIRGSSSRNGARAMRELAVAVQAGTKVVLTPDGPRGPRHAMNVGGAWLSRETGAPIVSVATAVDRAWRLRSWDACTIPKPFARIRISYGAPLQAAPQDDDAALERLSQRLREELLRSEAAGFAALGRAADF
jgi:lysophospholipid acyltransferase (LPLAT)-like uncharacterized protein